MLDYMMEIQKQQDALVFTLSSWRKLMSPNPRTKPEHSSLSLPKLCSWMNGTPSSPGTLCFSACSE